FAAFLVVLLADFCVPFAWASLPGAFFSDTSVSFLVAFRRSGKEAALPSPPPRRTGQAPCRCSRLKHETTHLSRHAVNHSGFCRPRLIRGRSAVSGLLVFLDPLEDEHNVPGVLCIEGPGPVACRGAGGSHADDPLASLDFVDAE